MKKVALITLVAIFYLSCQKTDVAADGIVAGTFTLSPLCGAISVNADHNNPCGLSDADLDKIYAFYTVQLISANSSKIVAEKKMDRTGSYSFSVPAGSYNLDYSPHITVGNTVNRLPSTFTVMSGQTMTVNLNINTGIR